MDGGEGGRRGESRGEEGGVRWERGGEIRIKYFFKLGYKMLIFERIL